MLREGHLLTYNACACMLAREPSYLSLLEAHASSGTLFGHFPVRGSFIPVKVLFSYISHKGLLGTAGDGWGRLGTAGDGWGRLGMLGTAGDRDL